MAPDAFRDGAVGDDASGRGLSGGEIRCHADTEAPTIAADSYAFTNAYSNPVTTHAAIAAGDALAASCPLTPAAWDWLLQHVDEEGGFLRVEMDYWLRSLRRRRG